MAEVELNIGGHRYRIGCESGQERQVHELAAMIDEEIMLMRRSAGNLGETRQLLYASLTLADRIKDAEKSNGARRPNPAQGGQNAEILGRLADRVEKLADMLEKRADGN